MVSIIVRPTRRIRPCFIMLIVGMLAFSPSALLLRDQVRPSIPLLKSQMRRRRNGRIKPLQVITDLFDAGADLKLDTSEFYSLGSEKDHDDADAKHTLTFQSSFERQSNPFARLSPDIKLDEFLMHSDHLLSAGKSVHSKIVPKTTELLEEWTIACDRVGACPPNADHGVIMSVRTAGISIPGLAVEWSALIGTNLVHRRRHHHSQHQYPELEMVMIKDETKSSGAKPIVWIYNKITKNGSNGNRKRRKRLSNMDTKMFTRLGFYDEKANIDNGKNESLVIRCTGNMEMKFRIPSMLGKFVFSSNADAQKAKAEQKVSNLISRQIEKDAEQNVLRWEENFRAWTQGANEFTKGGINQS